MSVAVLCALAGLGATAPLLAATTVTQFAYDAGNHVTKATDPRGLVTTYSYDGLGQKWQQVSPDTGTTTWGYDSYGRPTSMRRADGIQISYGYDEIGRTTSVTAGGQTQTFIYDTCTHGLGRLCTAEDATGTTSYSYSPEGWITGRGFSISGTTYALGYGYNAIGQVVSVVYPDGNQAVYSYTRGVVSGLTLTVGGTNVPGVSAITYQPMDAGMQSWTSSNGLVNTFSYDTDGRLTSISATGVQSLGLSYDDDNRIVGITNGIDATMSENFGYDEESRLRSVYSDADSQSFQYDADGNRLTQVRNGASVTYTTSPYNNQLTGLSGATSASYGYTPQGDITSVNGSTAYQYNPFNRLSIAGSVSHYVSPEGQRLAKAGGATGTTYFAPAAGGGLMAENDNGAWIDYVWLNGHLVGRIAGGRSYAIHTDQVGRPESVTDASRAVVWRARNFAFDRAVLEDSIGGLNLSFPGQYYDAETDTYSNGFRDYSAQLGRYVESDLIGLAGGINTYTYVGSNPISQIDPPGLWQVTISAELGIGGLLTFGYNSGQFNIGGYVGLGEGAAVSVNPGDSGCHDVGAWRGTRGDARLGAGVLGADVSATVGPGVNEGEVAVQTPVKNLILGVAVSDGHFSEKPITANVVVGESAFLGYGGQMYFGH
jgi:RHS repeat-associated protein